MEEKWLQEVSEKIKKKMLPVVKRNAGKIPYKAINGIYNDYSGDMIHWWTNGFWGGILWQLYHATGQEIYKQYAENLEEKLDAVLMDPAGMDHDSGFRWLPTSIANYRLTGNTKSRNRGLIAADNMAGRFNPIGKFIKAWNDEGTGEKAGVAIIDCMMNLPLLYWAYEETKDPRYLHIATLHADTSMEHFIREDGSVKHIIEFEPFSGEYMKSRGGQGYEHGSSWTRGQAWAIYGFALSYIHTENEKYLNCAKKVANYFITNTPKDFLIPIDFRQPLEPWYEDDIAAAVAACGMLEIAEHQTGADQRVYHNAAINMLKALDEKRCNWSEDTDYILEKCSGDYHGSEREIPVAYGDYYFIEAIWKLTNQELFIW